MESQIGPVVDLVVDKVAPQQGADASGMLPRIPNDPASANTLARWKRVHPLPIKDAQQPALPTQETVARQPAPDTGASPNQSLVPLPEDIADLAAALSKPAGVRRAVEQQRPVPPLLRPVDVGTTGAIVVQDETAFRVPVDTPAAPQLPLQGADVGGRPQSVALTAAGVEIKPASVTLTRAGITAKPGSVTVTRPEAAAKPPVVMGRKMGSAMDLDATTPNLPVIGRFDVLVRSKPAPKIDMDKTRSIERVSVAVAEARAVVKVAPVPAMDETRNVKQVVPKKSVPGGKQRPAPAEGTTGESQMPGKARNRPTGPILPVGTYIGWGEKPPTPWKTQPQSASRRRALAIAASFTLVAGLFVAPQAQADPQMIGALGGSLTPGVARGIIIAVVVVVIGAGFAVWSLWRRRHEAAAGAPVAGDGASPNQEVTPTQ